MEGELAGCGPAHSPTRSRETGEQQPELKARGNLGPRDGILHQTASKLPVANQVFLGSWMADICQEGHRQRSAPQRRHMAHLLTSGKGTKRRPDRVCAFVEYRRT